MKASSQELADGHMTNSASEADEAAMEGVKRSASTHSFHEEDATCETDREPLTIDELIDDKGEFRTEEPVYEIIEDGGNQSPVGTLPGIEDEITLLGGELQTFGAAPPWETQTIDQSVTEGMDYIEMSHAITTLSLEMKTDFPPFALHYLCLNCYGDRDQHTDRKLHKCQEDIFNTNIAEQETTNRCKLLNDCRKVIAYLREAEGRENKQALLQQTIVDLQQKMVVNTQEAKTLLQQITIT